MARLFVPLLVAIPLAGCGLTFAENGGPDIAVRAHDNGTIDPRTAGEEALSAGREAMRGGNLIAAMSAFRIAQRDPDCAAEATNGLGVAWATLGRYDLAEKMFLEAVALAPRDRRFASNLERVLAQSAVPGLRGTQPRRQFAGSLPSSARPSRRFNDAVEFRDPGDRLVRISRTEVRIVARDPSARPVASVSTTATSDNADAAARGPVIRVALPRAGDRIYPLRVTLPSSTRSASRHASTGVSYPLRVSLPAASRTEESHYPLRVALRPHRSTTNLPIRIDK